jgi:two-component system, sensor histidine kinase YesM
LRSRHSLGNGTNKLVPLLSLRLGMKHPQSNRKPDGNRKPIETHQPDGSRMSDGNRKPDRNRKHIETHQPDSNRQPRRTRQSLRAQLILNVGLSLIIIVLSMSYILFISWQTQRVVDAQFRSERFYQELQDEIEAIRIPFLEYLSSRSSKALADLLIREQTLRGMIPETIPITREPIDLTVREVYHLLESYLEMMDTAVQEKRGRAISEYTQLYETMETMNAYISRQIDKISLYGFREQLADYEQFITSSRELQMWNLLIIIFAFAWAISWIMHSISKITDPMHRLSQTAEELSKGNFAVEDIHVDAVAEVSNVVETFNRMKKDISQYIGEIQKQKTIEQEYLNEKLRNMKMEQLLKRMELYTMQAQMNPHFLFNTINTGVQLAIMEDADKTAEFMENLADFFRHNIRERQLFVPLKHEVEGLRSYFYILNIRFPKSLKLALEVPDDIDQEIQVPAMILQPLVENSVIHAFKGVERMGSIVVSISMEGQLLRFSVRDNGIGMEQEMVETLLQHTVRLEQYRSKVMGLENVIQRLHFFYPDNKRVVEIRSVPGELTEVIITIDTKEEPCITL